MKGEIWGDRDLEREKKDENIVIGQQIWGRYREIGRQLQGDGDIGRQREKKERVGVELLGYLGFVEVQSCKIWECEGQGYGERFEKRRRLLGEIQIWVKFSYGEIQLFRYRLY